MQDQAQKVIKDVFQTIEVETLKKVVSSVQIKQHGVGDYLCHEGSLERTFYIIVAGEIAIAKQRPDGTKEVLDVKKPGSFFGEMALLRNKPRTADAYTMSESVLIEMGIESFREIISHSPQFLDSLMRLMDKYDENHRRLRRPLIFTSYARKDQEIVKRLMKDLHSMLVNSPVEIWFDQTNIAPGKDWDEAVQDALQRTTAMLLVISSNAVKSKNVKSEWNYCMEEGKTIIPVLIDPNCEIPFRLKTYHYIDLTEYASPQHYKEGLERIAETLQEIGEHAEKNQDD
jgi:CRP-like cAMP-binding protein